MRWVGQGVLVLALVGCSRDNPWFVVNSAGAVDSEASSAGTTSAGSTAGSTADVGSSSSGAGDSGQVGTTTSTSTSISTTDPGESTSTSTTTDPGTSSSSDTGGDTDSSTGDPEQEALLYDLHFFCKNAAWSDGKKVVFCKEAAAEPPSVIQTSVMIDDQQFKAIEVIPTQAPQVPNAFVDGVYMVKLMGTSNPHFRATLSFPQLANVIDQITGQIYLENPMTMQVPVISEEFVLKPGTSLAIDVDLTKAQDVAVDLELHLVLTVNAAVLGTSSGQWLNPRVVHFP
ncbi:MAG: hypothetical protein H0T76_12865 [Nannocystis sp.]|nr:hypothetical protein [Nannocystis sp.]MBA3547371.1 hypothetical protein [Nannocystis sp.]